MYVFVEVFYSFSISTKSSVSIRKAKQINILGSRQHPAEKVALWCEFFIYFF